MTREERSLRLLGVFAHPDDESFSVGGTLAKYAAGGAEAMIVSATRGQAGQIRDARVATRRTLGAVREQELRRACQTLGVRHVECLDYMDGALQDVDRPVLVGSLVRVIRTFRPDVVLTLGPDGAYGHPDHVAVSAAVTEASRLAGSAAHYTDQLSDGVLPHAVARLYHAHFPRSRLLLTDRLAQWLATLKERFRGTLEFVQALSIFAQEASRLRYASDYIDVSWFPPGFSIVEQGEPGSSLYLILSGEAEVVHEEPDGSRRALARIGPGEFFGELALAHRQPRVAHVTAVSAVTCLVLSQGTGLFAGRGQDARLTGASTGPALPGDEGPPATTVIDVSAHVGQKIAALAAHRTQFPISPDMFPASILRELFSHEFFMRVLPPMEPETDLWPNRPLQQAYAGDPPVQRLSG